MWIKLRYIINKRHKWDPYMPITADCRIISSFNLQPENFEQISVPARSVVRITKNACSEK
jgi:hypothetical protein